MNALSEPSTADPVSDLRLRLARLRRELFQTTEAYRSALAMRESDRTIPLLRSRSHLMRELLDTQCQLLLHLRGQGQENTAEARAE